MSHGVRIRPPGFWVAGSTIDPAEAEALDAGQFPAINGDTGGTWAPSANVIIGGSFEWQFSNTVRLLTGAVGQLDSNATIILNSNSSLQVNNGASIPVHGGGQIQIQGSSGGGTLNLAAGSHITGAPALDPGVTFSVPSTAAISVAGGGTIGFLGSGGGAVLNLASGSHITGAPSLDSGVTFSVPSGAFIALGGTISVANAAGLAFTSGGFISGSPKLASNTVLTVTGGAPNNARVSFLSGSVLELQSGSIVSGAPTVSADLTLEGAVTLSGSAALFVPRRGVIAATSGTTTVDLRSADVWSLSVLTGNLVIIPTVAGVPTNYGTRIKRLAAAGAGVSNHSVEIQDGLGTAIAQVPVTGGANGNEFTADIAFNATAWELDLLALRAF